MSPAERVSRSWAAVKSAAAFRRPDFAGRFTIRAKSPSAGAELVRHDLGVGHAAVRVGMDREPLVDRREKIVGQLVAAHHFALRIGQLVEHQQAAVRAIVEEPRQLEVDLAAGNAQAEMVAGDGLDRVALRRESRCRNRAKC